MTRTSPDHIGIMALNTTYLLVLNRLCSFPSSRRTSTLQPRTGGCTFRLSENHISCWAALLVSYPLSSLGFFTVSWGSNVPCLLSLFVVVQSLKCVAMYIALSERHTPLGVLSTPRHQSVKPIHRGSHRRVSRPFGARRHSLLSVPAARMVLAQGQGESANKEKDELAKPTNWPVQQGHTGSLVHMATTIRG